MRSQKKKDGRTWSVSFSGIDGAGKSTQIEMLRSRLVHIGLNVRVIAFWDEVATLTKARERAARSLFRGDVGVGAPSAPIARRDKNVHSPLMTCVRLAVYLLDSVSLRIFVKNKLPTHLDFVIFDRYIYDQFANLNLRNLLIRAYVRLLMRIVPRPDISLLLDANPLQARARKPEYAVDFLYNNRAAYFHLQDLIGGITVIAPGTVEEVEREVTVHALHAMRHHGFAGMNSVEGSTEGRVGWT